jgi:hypothetical protein
MILNTTIINKCIVLHLQVEIFHYNCVQDAVSQSLRLVHYSILSTVSFQMFYFSY